MTFSSFVVSHASGTWKILSTAKNLYCHVDLHNQAVVCRAEVQPWCLCVYVGVLIHSYPSYLGKSVYQLHSGNQHRRHQFYGHSVAIMQSGVPNQP